VEVDLVKAYQAGSREALARIYRQYVRNVRDYLAHRIGGDADVADVVQEVFIRAFSEGARAKYDGTRDYGPFLRVIARNVFIDWVRRSRREVAVESDVLEAAMSRAVTESVPGPAAPHLETVTEYVNTLEPDLKSVYEARFLRAHSQEQAAAALGISRQTLRTRERTLLTGLRRKLQRGEKIVGRARR
jgi:RNA polymerase sigma-70 factor (ECF subfamily)